MENREPLPLVIVAEHTPDPHTVKLDPGRRMAPCGGGEFTDPGSAARGSPLASRLFEIPGISRVRVGLDCILVTKQAAVSWEDLAAPLLEAVRDHLEADRPILTPGSAAGGVPAAEEEAAVIQRVLEEELRPAMACDGGDVRFIRYRGGILEVALRGVCADCPSAIQTLRLGIEARLREVVPGLEKVVAR